MNVSHGGIISDLTLFLRVWKMKCKHPLSCGTQLFTTHPFFFLPLFSLPVAEYLYTLSVFLPWEQKACLVCVESGLLGVWERDAVHGPSVFDPVLKGEVGRLKNIPSSFSLFPVYFQKRDWMLDVDLSQCGSVHTQKKEEGCANTVRQQKLIEQKKSLERRVHGSG